MHIRWVVFTKRGDRSNQRLRPRHGRNTRYIVLQGGPPNRLLIKVRNATQRGVDDQRYLTALNVVHNVRTSFVNLENIFHCQSDFAKSRSGSERSNDLESLTHKLSCQKCRRTFVDVVDTDKCFTS